VNATGIQATLKAKGQAMTLSRSVPGVYDPVTGTMSGGVGATATVYGITSSYGSGITSKPDSLILVGDKKAIIDAVSVVPLPGDTLTIQCATWKIIAVDAVDPTGTALLFKCQVRK